MCIALQTGRPAFSVHLQHPNTTHPPTPPVILFPIWPIHYVFFRVAARTLPSRQQNGTAQRTRKIALRESASNINARISPVASHNLLSASISDEKLRVWTMPHLTMQLSISVMSLQP